MDSLVVLVCLDVKKLGLTPLLFLYYTDTLMDAITLTDANFEQEVMKSDIPVMVDFWAEWCQPCKMVSPLIDELAKEYEGKIKVGKLNVDENEKAGEYGVMSIPTIMIFKGGKALTTIIGVQSRDTYKSKIDSAVAS